MGLGFVKMLNSEPAGHEYGYLKTHYIGESSANLKNNSKMSLSENHAENLVSVQDTK